MPGMPWTNLNLKRRSSLIPSSTSSTVSTKSRNSADIGGSNMNTPSVPTSPWTPDLLTSSAGLATQPKLEELWAREQQNALLATANARSDTPEKHRRRTSLLGGFHIPNLPYLHKTSSGGSDEDAKNESFTMMSPMTAELTLIDEPMLPSFVKGPWDSFEGEATDTDSVPLQFNHESTYFPRRPSLRRTSSSPMASKAADEPPPAVPTVHTTDDIDAVSSTSPSASADVEEPESGLLRRPNAQLRNSSCSTRTTNTITPSTAFSSSNAEPPLPVSVSSEPEQPASTPSPSLSRKAVPNLLRRNDRMDRSKSHSVDITRVVSEGSVPGEPGAMMAPLLRRNKTTGAFGVLGGKRVGEMGEYEETEQQRLRNVWRARKMAQVFGSEPPKELLQHIFAEYSASESSSTSPASSAIVTPSTSLDFGCGNLPPPSPHTTDDTYSILEAEAPSDDEDRVDFRLRRLRARKLTRFFGTAPPAEGGYNDYTPPCFEDTEITYTPPREEMRRGSKDESVAVDEWNPEQMQEVMAKLRRLR